MTATAKSINERRADNLERFAPGLGLAAFVSDVRIEARLSLLTVTTVAHALGEYVAALAEERAHVD
ncbi:MAG: hypothetical protein ACFB00_11620 [Parvularculaceae bacterium]